MEHLADELDLRRFVGVLLLELHDKSESPILKGGIGRSNNNGIPAESNKYSSRTDQIPIKEAYQVMTLSGTGEAETPAGGSVCMRCSRHQYFYFDNALMMLTDLEIAHQATSGGGRHVDGFGYDLSRW